MTAAEAMAIAQQTPASSAAELERGVALTRNAHFAEAIPLLQRAIAGGADGYAARFNLALCYVGAMRYQDAVASLQDLRSMGVDTAGMKSLLAQALLGEAKPDEAWVAMQQAADLAPRDEKMYALLADACQDDGRYTLGLRVTDVGLQNLPGSARLHYARALFLAELDRLNEAKPEFAAAQRLGADTSLGTLAGVQLSLYEDQFTDAAAQARRAIAGGDRSATILTLLGNVLLAAGATPGQPAFAEAEQVLREAVAQEPGYATAEIALGSLELRQGRAAEALPRLEEGRRLEPENRAVYAQLAAAYRATGQPARARQCMQQMGSLVQAQQAARLQGP